MAERTSIEWAQSTWNPLTGCTMVSAGCTNCYAMRLAGGRMKNHPTRQGLTKETPNGPVWTGEVRFNEAKLDEPLRWKRPRRIFVCAHSDLFHPAVPDEWLQAIFTIMDTATEHTYQILTKRPERAVEWVNSWQHFPLQNHIWIGTSVENEDVKAERIGALLSIPAEVRWLSMEPLIGPVVLDWRQTCGDCDRCLGGRPDLCDLAYTVGYTPQLDWVVVGGESGPGARPMEHEWAQSIVNACRICDVPVFVKQLSQANFPHSYKDYDAFPESLRVRQYPAR